MPPVDHHRLVLATTPQDREVDAARLWAAGAVGVWERPGELVAWFATPTDAVPAGGRWELEADRDWQAEWKATVRPVTAGRVVIVPTWLADDHVPARDELTLILDPGRAFGTGHHATTTMCLELLDELELEGRTLADVGCGSGVLAIAAARRGARVVAVDVDPDAIEVTRENAERNGAALEARHGSVDVLDRTHEVVIANLLTDTVAALADELTRACSRTLVVSGIASDRREVALGPLREAGWELIEVLERDGWVAARGRPPTAGET
jgi:ribosomal protein L11 methyltransferase